MSKARELADVIGTQDTTENVLQGRKNLIINGAMQVAQRGTSFSSNGYTLDRWRLSLSDATITVTQEAFTLGQTEVAGNPKNYLKVACSTGNGNGGINQPIENYAAGAGGPVTVSFWAKGTNPGGGYLDLQLWQRMSNGTGFHETDLVLNPDWTYHTFTINLGSLSGFTANSSSNLDLIIRQPDTDSSTNAWELNLAQVQVELGSVATPFEHRSYGEELALCQRYYHFTSGDWPYRHAISGNYSGTSLYPMCYFPVEMRTTPSLTVSSGTGFRVETYSGQIQQTTGVSFNTATTKHAVLTATCASNFNNGGNLNGYSSSRLSWDAEL